MGGKTNYERREKIIYNNNLNEKEKLKNKLEYLEKQREFIKEYDEHSSWQLQNIGAMIRETKRRMKRLDGGEC